jgi:hypothetical protein
MVTGGFFPGLKWPECEAVLYLLPKFRVGKPICLQGMDSGYFNFDTVIG